jgi:hypothetical protein
VLQTRAEDAAADDGVAALPSNWKPNWAKCRSRVEAVAICNRSITVKLAASVYEKS